METLWQPQRYTVLQQMVQIILQRLSYSRRAGCFSFSYFLRGLEFYFSYKSFWGRQWSCLPPVELSKGQTCIPHMRKAARYDLQGYCTQTIIVIYRAKEQRHHSQHVTCLLLLCFWWHSRSQLIHKVCVNAVLGRAKFRLCIGSSAVRLKQMARGAISQASWEFCEVMYRC